LAKPIIVVELLEEAGHIVCVAAVERALMEAIDPEKERIAPWGCITAVAGHSSSGNG